MLDRPKRGRLQALSALVAAIALLVLAANASAARDPIASGTTDLHMKKGFLRKVNNLGVTVRAIGVGTQTGNKLGFPVDGGKLDPTDVRGFVESRGGFKFELGKRGVPVTRMTVNTANLMVFATVAKAHMQVGSLIPVTSAREGFGSNFKSIKLALSAKAVRRISNRLGLKGSKRLNPGRVLSNLYTAAQPETVTLLKKGDATFQADPTALAKLEAKGVKVPEGLAPLAPATKSGAATFALPIAGGNLAPDVSKGTVETSGGVQILKEAKEFSPTVRMRKFNLDFGTKSASAELEILPSPPFPGAAGRSSIVDVVLPPNSVAANPVTRQISVQNAEARLQIGAASTLNDVFNQPPPAPPSSSNFVVGDPLGTFSMLVEAQ